MYAQWKTGTCKFVLILINCPLKIPPLNDPPPPKKNTTKILYYTHRNTKILILTSKKYEPICQELSGEQPPD